MPDQPRSPDAASNAGRAGQGENAPAENEAQKRVVDAPASTTPPRSPSASAASKRRGFIEPGSVTEMRVLMELIEHRESGDWPMDHDSDEWKRIAYLLERSIAMHAIGDAFTELVDDEKTLADPSEVGNFGAAIAVSLDRNQFGSLQINVKLNQIDGGQLAYVLDVARRHELVVREENGWLCLSPQLIETADDEEREPEEARA